MYQCSPVNALLEAFVRTDAVFRNELDSHRKSKRVIQKDWHPGCTAVAALIVRNRLFVANAGDCRVILCRGGHPYALSRVRQDLFTFVYLVFVAYYNVLCTSLKPTTLTCQDHVASCLEERERVVNAGGQVKWQVDTWRVGPAALQVIFFILKDFCLVLSQMINVLLNKIVFQIFHC